MNYEKTLHFNFYFFNFLFVFWADNLLIPNVMHFEDLDLQRWTTEIYNSSVAELYKWINYDFCYRELRWVRHLEVTFVASNSVDNMLVLTILQV